MSEETHPVFRSNSFQRFAQDGHTLVMYWFLLGCLSLHESKQGLCQRHSSQCIHDILDLIAFGHQTRIGGCSTCMQEVILKKIRIFSDDDWNFTTF